MKYNRMNMHNKQTYVTSVNKENMDSFKTYTEKHGLPFDINHNNEDFYVLTLFASKKELRAYRREFETPTYA